ncbi:MAG TPA: 5'/3'-nucleotidase SurE [Phycisphaerae bacterium]|nr:5'/3'-nucleotidase SurE [Phycisphaerae bacterium]HOB75504.1 5'/3'-nucleotidase SurE [Phycisphaerae bacterium]HOJ56724.1 5'/3'-nucleotidase SurE [Phycisphaerae bacterium]HOL27170.1 5'/3'-nucleotidase SurE [Phycisphaerae bacterium]HPP21577.1 5'/3'-nucleotidase SurE [Phycisphaerae bacterium]
MRILLSNDDGILAPGLAALREVLLELGEVSVVAPASVQSAAGHGITVTGPLAVRRVHVQDSFFGHAVEGRPADCVKLAINHLLEAPPDLVVSGINDGANVATNVLYSGTVAAAAEGALLGYPAIAVSMERGEERDFRRAARITLPIIRQLLDRGLAAGSLININLPDLAPGLPRGVRVVPQATRVMEDDFVRFAGPDGRDYYWLAEGRFKHADPCESDLDALNEGYIAITPLQFDLTQYELLSQLQACDWNGKDVRTEK